MSPTLIFLLGSVGALAPEIVRLYSIRNNPAQFQWSWFYLIVSILFACLGGVFALVLPATTLWGSIYVGISTPTLISTALEKGIELSQPEYRGPSLPTRKYSKLMSFIKGL